MSETCRIVSAWVGRDDVCQGFEARAVHHRKNYLAHHLLGVPGHDGRTDNPARSAFHVDFDKTFTFAVDNGAVNFAKRPRKAEALLRPDDEIIRCFSQQ